MISEGCAYHGASSRICERGTGGCEIHHAAESAPQETPPAVNNVEEARTERMKCQSCGTEAPCPSCADCGAVLAQVVRDTPQPAAEPVEGVVDFVAQEICKVIHGHSLANVTSQEVVSCRKAATAALAVAREGYVKRQDAVEKLCKQQHEALKRLVGEIVKDGGKRPYDTSMNLSRAVLTAYDALFPAKKGGAK